MNLPDNNVLINAFRSETKHHAKAKSWLEGSLNNSQSIRLFPTVETGFLRVVTHPRIFDSPSPFEEASEFLKVLCSSTFVDVCQWTVSARNLWFNLCDDLALSGNDCNDAMLAAIAMDRGLRLVTFDKGFKRFEKLQLLLLRDSPG